MDTNGWLGQLVEQGMHDSACLLGEFLLAPQGAAQRDAGAAWLPAPTCETYVLYADALVGRGEQRRALPYLHQALQCARTPRGRAPAGSAADGSAARPSLASECEIKLRIARCYVALNESRNALACLMGIPSSARNASATLLLARLLEASGNHRAAASAHKEVLRGTPIVLESAIALAQLGTPVREIFAIQPLLAHLPWLVQLLHAHSAEGLHDATRAHEAFGALGAHFEGSTHVLLHTARAALFRGHDDEALALFQRARDADGNLVDGMDVFARGLAKADRGAELGRLCRELLFIDRRRPEPWGAVATYWTMRGEHARALEHCERALSIDERHPFAHQLKGSLLASLARPEQAVYAYRKANAIRADLDSFIGLVNAYLHIEKCREALSVAREAVQLMPNSARAHALLGSALCAQPNAQDKTKRVRARVCAHAPCVCGRPARVAACAPYAGRHAVPFAAGFRKGACARPAVRGGGDGGGEPERGRAQLPGRDRAAAASAAQAAPRRARGAVRAAVAPTSARRSARPGGWVGLT